MSVRHDEIASVLADAAARASDVLRRERRAAVLGRLAGSAGRSVWIAAIGPALMIASGGGGALWEAGRIALGLALLAGLLVLANELSATRDVDERDALER